MHNSYILFVLSISISIHKSHQLNTNKKSSKKASKILEAFLITTFSQYKCSINNTILRIVVFHILLGYE